jgi:hypothetical protein
VLDALSAMQALYRKWAHALAWDKPRSLSNYPSSVNEALLNSASLHRAGHSTAVDYWRRREKPNFVRLSTCTGEPSGTDTSGHSHFYVLQARRIGDVMPADGTIDVEFARALVCMLTSSGEELTRVLTERHMVVGAPADTAWHVDMTAIDKYFHDHCVVVFGHMPQMYWRRSRKGVAIDRGVCSCLRFVQHAECEHRAFVAALRGGPPNLDSVPEVRQRGRKRKA